MPAFPLQRPAWRPQAEPPLQKANTQTACAWLAPLQAS